MSGAGKAMRWVCCGRGLSGLLGLHYFARSDANHARHTFFKKKRTKKNLNKSWLGFARLCMK